MKLQRLFILAISLAVWGFSQIPYDGSIVTFEDTTEASTTFWSPAFVTDTANTESYLNLSPNNSTVAVGNQSMKIDYAVLDAQPWGGFSSMDHNLPGSELYDFSGYDSIAFYYYISSPSSLPGRVTLRFNLMDVSDSPQGDSTSDITQSEYYYSFHRILDSAPGWNRAAVRLVANPVPDTLNTDMFNRMGWNGIPGNEHLDLNKIKGMTIEFSISGNGSQASSNGSIYLDHISLVSPTDSLALVAFYDSLGGDAWTDNSNWKTANPIDTWFGVTVTAGHVTKLQMINNNLTGVIPAAVGDLDSLEQFLVGSDPISGPIPQSIFNLKKLFYLYITGTGMGGGFPSEILNLTNLRWLDLAGNGFTGNLPAGISSLTKLESIRVGSNNLGPTLPSELESLPLLNDLWIESNNYSGSFPLFLTNMQQIQSLNISANNFSGTLPPEIGNFVNLGTVYWSSNNFSGEIPQEIGKMTSATFLQLYNNNFTGAIPDSIVNMSSLQYLRLQGNQLSGAVPPGIAQMTELKEIRVDDNMLTDFPDVSALPNLTELRLNNNQFSFADIEPNVGITTYYYNPQDSMGIGKDTTLIQGTNYTIFVDESSANDVYVWKKNGVAFDTTFVGNYTIPSIDFPDAGSYSYEITNTVATGLTIIGRPTNVTVAAAGRQTDSLALVSIYNSLDGANWTDSFNWLTPNPIQTWAHVTVSGGRVTQLNLNNSNISGTIPQEVGNLTALQALSMDGAGLTGTLPPELGNLTSLWYLGITYSSISGSIPPEIGNLTNLQNLYFYNNNLSGSLPSELGNLTSLLAMFLGGNSFTGSIPSTFGNLVNIQEIQIYGGNLTGALPDSMSALTNLVNLNLSGNSLSGVIPSWLGNMTQMDNLSLNSNQFSGSIPPELGNMTVIQILNLSNNSLTDTIPSSLGNLTNAWALYLFGNQLSGSIPSALGNMTGLMNLRLNANNLTGSVPQELGALPNLDEINLQDNMLTGLPNLGAPGNLNNLYVQNNRFTFEDIEANIGVATTSFTYSPQDTVGRDTTIVIPPGRNVVLRTNVGGSQNWYTWYLNGSEIPNENADTLLISNADEMSDEGNYTYTVTSPLVPGLTLYSRTTYIDVNPDAGLKAKYYFNADAVDMSGNGNDGVLTDGVQPVPDKYGRADRALSFDGTGYIILPVNPTLQPAEKLTVSSWFKTTSPIYGYLIAGDEISYALTEYPDSVIFTLKTGGSISSVSYVAAINDGKWHNVVGSYDGSEMKIYFDGTLKNSLTKTGSIPYFDNPINIGSYQADGNYFNGSMDGMRIYDRALSAFEVDSLYHRFGWNGGNDLTFQVDMSLQIELGNFDLADAAELRGSFDNWGSGVSMSDGNGDQIYDVTHYVEGLTGDSLEYKFLFNSGVSGINWEDTPNLSYPPNYNRVFQLTGGPETLPVVYFNNVDPRTNDSLALVALYDSLGGDNWIDNSSWKIDPIDSWFGVTVDAGRVTQLDLNSNNLIGEIPSEIGNLTALFYLNLGGNDFSGGMAKNGQNHFDKRAYLESLEEPGEVINKTITGRNKIAGGLPAKIGRLSNLQYLYLNDNNLTAALPAEMGDLNSLLELSLAGNPLSELQLPPELGNITTLNSLSLDHMNINNFPAFITNMTNLTFLELWHNNLTSVPVEIGNLTNLTFLDLDENQISSFPAEFANLTALTELWISNPLFEVPTQIASFTNLQTLGIWNSGLDDADVTDINRFPTSILNLYLFSNNLTVVPPILSGLPNLSFISLGNNQISNSGLQELTSVSNLTYINLADNILDAFPSEVFSHPNLNRLYLQRNNMSGSVPPEINSLDTLQTLMVHNNHLDSLPAITLSYLNYLYVDSNNLTFEDLEPNIGVPLVEFRYGGQDSVGMELDTTIQQDNAYTMSVNVGGSDNSYQWFHDGNLISGANSSSYTINSFYSGDEGEYHCEVTNGLVPGLTIYSRSWHLNYSGGITYFQVDMSVAMVKGLFDPGTDSVVIGGNIQGSWQTSPPFVDQGRLLYMIDAQFDSTFGMGFNYQYMIKYANGDSLLESIPERYVDIVDYDTTLAPVFFNDDNFVTIQQVQAVANPTANDTSIFYDKEVKLRGLVMVNPDEVYVGTRRGVFIYDPDATPGTTNTGLLALQSDTTITTTGFQDLNEGDIAVFTGQIIEFYHTTEIIVSNDPDKAVIVESSGNPLPDPLLITSADIGNTANGEQYESMLVAIDNAAVIDDSIGNNQAALSDASGEDFYLDDFFIWFRTHLFDQSYSWPATGSKVSLSGFVRDFSRADPSVGYQVNPRTQYDVSVITNLLASDSLAIVALYDSLGGTNWVNKDGWLTSTPARDWYGVGVNNGRVISIELQDNNLQGQIPNAIGDLTSLVMLNLSGSNFTDAGMAKGAEKIALLNAKLSKQQKTALNKFNGTLPASIGNLVNLQTLILSGTNLTAGLPSEMGNLSSLQELNLSNNPLDETMLPAELGNLPNLISLDLSNMLLNNFPAFIPNLPTLQGLSLWNNNIGSLPEAISSLTNLMFLDLDENNLTALPTGFSSLTALTELWISNPFGGVPGQITNLSNLNTLGLWGMGLTDGDFSGLSLPVSIEVLYLNDNNLTAAPALLSDFTNLREIYLRRNQINDGGVGEFAEFSNLEVISLSYNMLTIFPSEILGHTNLRLIGLHHNEIAGALPVEINNLGGLSRFYMHNNRFSDLPPLTFTNLTELTVDSNRFEFDDIIPNVNIASNLFRYAPQDSALSRRDTLISAGSTITLDMRVGGTGNSYLWMRTTALGTDTLYTNEPTGQLSGAGAGFYRVEVTNPEAPDLTLYSHTVHVKETSANLLTFQVNMRVKALESLFSPAQDTVWLKGSFNGWGESASWILTDIDGDSIYTGTFDVGGNLNDVISYKFYYRSSGTEYWEQIENRVFTLTDNPETLPVVYFDDDDVVNPPVTTVNIVFRVNMNVQISDGIFRPGDGHTAVVRGDFNQWGNDGDLMLVDLDGNGIYIGTAALQPGTDIVYRFARKTGPTTVIMESNDRNYNVPSTGEVLPAVFFNNDAIPQAFSDDSLAVVSLFNAWDGTNWNNHSNWLNAQPLGSWFGVTLKNGRVSKIELSDNNLTGEIPAAIGNLTALEVLSAQNNNISGTIPSGFGNLTKLIYLDLGDNDLEGNILPAIGNFSNLTHLYLQNNGFFGVLPAELTSLSNLTQIDLSYNDFWGGISANWTNLVSMNVIRLSYNGFDQLPDLTSLPNLSAFVVDHNELTFEDIVPNVGISGFIYAPQDSLGEPVDTTKFAGDAFSYTIDVTGHDNNRYEWIKDGSSQGFTDNTLTISSLLPENDGEYLLRITNNLAPALTLYSYPLNLHVIGGLPIIQSLTVEAVAVKTADISAVINPNYLTTSIEFTWGVSSDSENSIGGTPESIEGSSPQTVTAHLTNLSENTEYHFNVFVGNNAGSLNWTQDEKSFTTHRYPTEETTDTTITSLPRHSAPSQYQSIDYRMVGLPGNTGIDIGDLLGSGSFDKDWMVYWDNGADQDYLQKYDGSAEFNMTLGKAFWVVSLKDIPVQMNIPMPGLTPEDEISIPLHSGWNLITNPFLLEVLWNKVQVANGISWKLNFFNGSWDKNNSRLKPYFGYMVFNEDNRSSLKIPYPTSLNKQPAALVEADWKVNLSMAYNETENLEMSFGVASDADEGKDLREFHTPRMFADVPGAWFERKEWDEKYSDFSEDFRPAIDELQSWQFNTTVQKNVETSFRFDGIEEIPVEFDVVLFDHQLKRSHSLRDDPTYKITSPQTKRSFEVIVGDPDMVEEKLASMLPQVFTLEPNFPNPFNPTTVIPIEIPAESDVTVEIFDILGKRVKVLHKGLLDVGRHLLTWDGRNAQGTLMSSGVYFYRMHTSSGENVTRKMILMK